MQFLDTLVRTGRACHVGRASLSTFTVLLIRIPRRPSARARCYAMSSWRQFAPSRLLRVGRYIMRAAPKHAKAVTLRAISMARGATVCRRSAAAMYSS
jgi:hypothetical protein